MPKFTLKFKILFASLLLFGSIATLFYNQIVLNSKAEYALQVSTNALNLNRKTLEIMVTQTATPSPTLVPAFVKPASKSAVKR